MELNFTPNDRGQVGIGTLIVFIAMVLVAAIAAGVLINTAGFLQTQAEDTGTESTEQVANNLNVINEVGIVNDTGAGEGEITDVEIGVQPAAGSDDINLEQLSLQFVSDNEFSNLVHVKSVAMNDEEDQIVGEDTVFNTVPVTAEDGEDNVMTDGADRYDIEIPLQAAAPFGNASESQDGEDLDDSDSFDFDAVEGDENDIVVIVDDSGDEALTTENLDSSVEGVEQLEDDQTDDEDTTLVLRFDDLNVQNLPTYDERDIELPGDTNGDVTDAPSIRESFLDPTDIESGIGNGLGTLDEGEEAEITYTTETGAQTVSILQVPDSLAGEDDDDAVDL